MGLQVRDLVDSLISSHSRIVLQASSMLSRLRVRIPWKPIRFSTGLAELSLLYFRCSATIGAQLLRLASSCAFVESFLNPAFMRRTPGRRVTTWTLKQVRLQLCWKPVIPLACGRLLPHVTLITITYLSMMTLATVRGVFVMGRTLRALLSPTGVKCILSLVGPLFGRSLPWV